MKMQNLNQRQAYWILYLLRFDFTLKYVPNTKMEIVNRLSKRLDQKVGTKNNNSNQTLIKEARSKNKKIVRVVENMKKNRSKNIKRGFDIEKRKDLYAERQRVKSGNNLVVP